MTNPLCHFELMCADVDRCRAFYESVFGWRFDETSMPGYTLVDTGREPTGGIFAKPSAQSAACMNVYFKVENIDRCVAAAVEKGAKVLVPKSPIPGVGQFAMFADPDGIAIGIMQQGG